ncbi:hypothetical protein G9A89_022707 [Geosiphon pyriformis]|nr:hypothetical protein G9A89_022707 [Geosiphon pyriformis]
MKSGVHSDWAVVIKKIPMDTPKEMIVAAVTEFGEIKSIKIQLIGMWQKTVVEFAKSSQADQFDVIWCGKYGCLGHSALECNALNVSSLVPISPFKKPVSGANRLQLAKLYARKNVFISRPAAFGDKSWAQVVSVASSSDGSSSGSGFDSSAFSLGVFGLGGGGSLLPNDDFLLGAHLASLECSLGLLHDQVSHIVCKLSGVNLVLLASFPSSSGVLAVPATADIDMILDTTSTIPVVTSSLPSVGLNLGSSSSKVLTSKIGSLESKLAALDASVSAILGKLDQLCVSLGSQMATCNMRGINNPAKQDDIIHWHKDMNNLVSIFTESKLKGKVRPWIVNKFDGVRVFTSGMESGYLGAGVVIVMDFSLARHTDDINSLIAKAVNEFSFIILGGNFNEDGSHKYASFRKCLDMSLVNALGGNFCGKLPTWSNSRGIAKTIDYMLISSNLVNAVVGRDVVGVGEYFDIDYQAVSMWVGLGSLLDVQLNSVCKQINKDRWKYNCKDADDIKWAKFKKDTAANAAMFYDNFLAARIYLDLDSMWVALRKVMCLSAEAVFKRK